MGLINLELIGLLAVFLLLVVLLAIGNIFEDCKQKGYLALIPVINLMVLLKITLSPRWWLLPLLIPGVNLYFLYKIFSNLSIGFGRERSYAIKILLLPFIYLPILAYYGKFEDKYSRKLIMDYKRHKKLKSML